MWIWPAASSAAVHHVGRRDDVGARCGVRQRLLHQHRRGDVVHHVAVVVDDAVLAVRGVRVEGDVGDHPERRHGLLERADRALHQSFRVPGLAAVERLGRAVRHREQRERRDAQPHQFLGLLDQFVDADPLDAGHRRYRHALPGALDDEHRVDQVVGGQPCLAHQPAGERVPAHAAHAHAWEGAWNRTHRQPPQTLWAAIAARPNLITTPRRPPSG